MNKLLLIISLLIIFSWSAVAQCIPAIPSTAIVVDSTQTVNGGFDPLWVCGGDTLHSDGGFHNIFLEPGAVMTTGGGIDTIYVKSGASLFMNGGIHVIYYVKLIDVTIAGGIPTLDSCVAIFFDYSNAPANGCLVAPPIASFQSSDSMLCAGTCINFTDSSINTTSWNWFFPGATTATSTDENPQNICYTIPGSYDVTLIASNGNGHDTLILNNLITVFPLPQLPPITQIFDTLFTASGFTTYQWYLGTQLLTGATNYYYVASQNGSYKVVVTDTNGCDTFALFGYQSAGMNQVITNMPFTIFPNPAKNKLAISINPVLISALVKQNAFIEIYNLFGIKVFDENINLSSKHEINFEEFSAGVYFVKLFFRSNAGVVTDKVYVKKLIVE
ncbi:MAG: T9SS type A sorting domain-containing protein [Bacteroidia bacterium]